MQNKWRGRVRSPKLIIATILVLASFFAVNQEAIAGITGKVAGTVRDAETGETLPAANCILVGTELGAACDVDGDYFIINIPPGSYSLEVRMMGYESVTQTGIIVTMDHTTPVDFELRPVAVAVPGITVVARREIVKLDLASSRITARAEELRTIPLVRNIGNYVNMQAGVDGWSIRGGGEAQTQFMVDGLLMVNNRTAQISAQPNLTSIKEINVIKGGFNAEYGNVRSGVVNILTKEGSSDEYHGLAVFHFTPAHYKHRGLSIFDPDNFYLRPYLETEDSVCWLGTSQWHDTVAAKYEKFDGWIDVAEDMTPEEARDKFIWTHTAEGAGDLIPAGYDGDYEEGHYGDKPDMMVDVSFGGPIPGIKGLTFHTSYMANQELFGLPIAREYFKESNSQLRLTYRINPNMKLGLTGGYRVINSVSDRTCRPNSITGYLNSGRAALTQSRITEQNSAKAWWGGRHFYYRQALVPFDVYNTSVGLTLDHALSPSTFYNLRLTYRRGRNECYVDNSQFRDTSTVRLFGTVGVDEAPYGYTILSFLDDDGMSLSGHHSGGYRDSSSSYTFNAKWDLNSQFNKYNEVKMGFEFNYDNLKTNLATEEGVGYITQRWQVWEGGPIRVGAYLQDKLEFEGMIANLGVRIDYFNPNIEWFTLERYSAYFGPGKCRELTEEAPREPAESQLKISPRLGISHPVSLHGKIFFNYGHFYQLATAQQLYRINYDPHYRGIDYLGNPSALMPKTVAYELGYAHEIAGNYLVSITGYYRDISDQLDWIYYEGLDIDPYRTLENNEYEDVRGFEVSIGKRAGRWIRGFINYDYRSEKVGRSGRLYNYEDKRLERAEGLQDPFQEKALPRPDLHANLQLLVPEDLGPIFGAWNLSLLYSWQSGAHSTWDPLETGDLYMNIQWEPYANLDAQLTKAFSFGSYRADFFVEVHNVLDTKHLSVYGSNNLHGAYVNNEQDDYMRSLHLPMYDGEEYESADLIYGNDRPGDIRSKDKPYIVMPRREFLNFLDPRTVTFGLRFNF